MTSSQSIHKKILIVGQGIAGTALAHTLSNYPAHFTIIDNGYKSSASKVASGTYNPLVLKRLIKSWKIDELLPFAWNFYNEVSQKLGCSLIESQVHYRKIAQDSELLDWTNKIQQEEYSLYLSHIANENEVHNKLIAPWGYGAVKNVGKIDVMTFLQESRSLLKDQVISEELDYSKVLPTDDYVEYNGQKYDDVIFCEGYKVEGNPFFQEAEMKPVKGENLVLKIPGLNLKHVIKSNIYILPVGNDIYHIGSTYQWDILDEKPSTNARDSLLEKLKTITTLPFEIINQLAGVRPSSKDRRPIIGSAKKHKRLHLLNGLGAKGLVLSPYFAHQLCEHIFYGLLIDKEVDLKRFYTLED